MFFSTFYVDEISTTKDRNSRANLLREIARTDDTSSSSRVREHREHRRTVHARVRHGVNSETHLRSSAIAIPHPCERPGPLIGAKKSENPFLKSDPTWRNGARAACMKGRPFRKKEGETVVLHGTERERGRAAQTALSILA